MSSRVLFLGKTKLESSKTYYLQPKSVSLKYVKRESSQQDKVKSDEKDSESKKIVSSTPVDHCLSQHGN